MRVRGCTFSGGSGVQSKAPVGGLGPQKLFCHGFKNDMTIFAFIAY